MVMCTSWILEVRSEGTTTARSQKEASGPPEQPVNAMVLQPIALAFSAALTTFGDFPLALIATRTSPAVAKASTCRAKTSS